MGNIEININDIVKIEKQPFTFQSVYKIYLKNGNYYNNLFIDNEISLHRLENYLKMPYSKNLTNSLMNKIREANNEKIPFNISEYKIVFNNKQIDQTDHNSIKQQYSEDMVNYFRLTVHRDHFEARIRDVLDNKDTIYTEKFIENWRSEKEKFLNLLIKKTELFKSGSKL